jgi:hypothetical protein
LVRPFSASTTRFRCKKSTNDSTHNAILLDGR